MPARNSDGTIRNVRSPMILKPRSIRARWVTAEILRCKRTGLSMAVIAIHIGRVGPGIEESDQPSSLKLSAKHRKTANRRRTGFHIPSVRNPVAESTACLRLGLDLDGSTRLRQTWPRRARASGQSHLVRANRGVRRSQRGSCSRGIHGLNVQIGQFDLVNVRACGTLFRLSMSFPGGML